MRETLSIIFCFAAIASGVSSMLCDNSEAGQLAPILPVGTSYGSGSGEVIGAGTLIEFDDPEYSGSQFLLTDAHLVQGKDVWVEGEGGRKIHAIGVISNADPDKDAAIVEIPRTQLSPAYVYKKNSSASGFELVATEALKERLKCDVEGCGKAPQVSYFMPGTVGKVNSNTIYALLPRWATQGGVYRYSPKEIESTPLGVRVGDLSLPPGSSGSLVFSGDPSYSFSGAPISYERFETKVSYSSRTEFIRLLELYKKGVRGPQGKMKWKLKRGLLFRSLGDGYEEVQFESGPAGGNGVTAPPGGNGVSAPPGGNGVSAPPGDPTECAIRRGNDLPITGPSRKNFEDLVGISLRLSRDDLFLGPKEILKRYGITSNISKDGKPVFGFRVIRAATRNGRVLGSFVLAPNAESKYWKDKMESERQGYRIDPIFEAPDVASVLLQKRPSARRTMTITSAKRGAPENGMARIRIVPNGIAISWTLPDVAPQKGRTDTVEVTLDRQGRAIGAAYPIPIMEVKGRVLGEKYLLDTRKLFSVDLSLPYKEKSIDRIAKSMELRLIRIRDGKEMVRSF